MVARNAIGIGGSISAMNYNYMECGGGVEDSKWENILACYLSGQMNEKQWQEHMQDKLFCLWYHHREGVKK